MARKWGKKRKWHSRYKSARFFFFLLFFFLISLSSATITNEKRELFFYIQQISYASTSSMILFSWFLLIFCTVVYSQSILIIYNFHWIIMFVLFYRLFRLLYMSIRIIRSTSYKLPSIYTSNTKWFAKTYCSSRIFINQTCLCCMLVRSFQTERKPNYFVFRMKKIHY
jgi:hypothetical protein